MFWGRTRRSGSHRSDAAGVPLVLVLYFTLKMLQIQDPTRQVHCRRVHQESLEVHSAPLLSIFCREICSFLFLVVFSQLEQFNKPLSSFSWQIDIGVLCVSCRYACVFGAFYRYLTSTIPDIHSLVWLLLGERMSYVWDPRNEIINQKMFFSLSWLCSMSTPAHFILIWTFSYDNILGFNIWHPYSCVASYLSSPL